MIGRLEKHGRVSVTLAGYVKLPSPTTKGLDGGSHSRAAAEARGVPRELLCNGGALNPQWVAWLMGWPIAWTRLQLSATARYHSVAPQPGESLEDHKP
jgi:hypothetical protein